MHFFSDIPTTTKPEADKFFMYLPFLLDLIFIYFWTVDIFDLNCKNALVKYKQRYAHWRQKLYASSLNQWKKYTKNQ